MNAKHEPTAQDFCHFVAEAARNAAAQGLKDFPSPGAPRNFVLDRMADSADAIIRVRQLVLEGAEWP